MYQKIRGEKKKTKEKSNMYTTPLNVFAASTTFSTLQHRKSMPSGRGKSGKKSKILSAHD